MDLQQRVERLESENRRWKVIGATVLLVVSVGFAWHQSIGQPQPVHGQPNRGLIVRVAELETKLNKLSRLEWKHRIERKQDKDGGYLLVGDLLICWGHAALKAPKGGPHLRHFDFEFLKAFVDLPTVTTGFDQESFQNALGIYNSKLTTTRFSGEAYDNRSSAEAPGVIRRVRMSYTAIGRPKPSR